MISLRGFIRAFRASNPKEVGHSGALQSGESHFEDDSGLSMRDVFGPGAPSSVDYGSESHEELVNKAPRSLYRQREQKRRDRENS